MSERAVIGVKSIPGLGSIVEVVEELQAPSVDINPRRLPCDPGDPEFISFRRQPSANGFTAAVGRKLFDGLGSSPSVAEQLTFAVAQKKPVYITDQGAEAQALPWEALCRSSDGRFLALDSLPLGRMVGRLEAQELGLYIYDPPVRILAVLAAAGGAARDTAMGEWRALSAAVAAVDVPCRLQVIGADADVQAAVEAELGAGSFLNLVSADTVIAAARDFRPHVLHLFCHGFADPEPTLELATPADQKGPDPSRGSVKLDRRSFEQIRLADPALWLVTLDCCLGAAASDSGQPLGRQIVQAGVPAVVAMQEPVDRRDVHLFCRHFYEPLLAEIHRAYGGPAPRELDWARALVDPRRRLLLEHEAELGGPEHCKEWTLPVVYVHGESFRVIGKLGSDLDPMAVAKLMSELDELERTRSDLAKLPNLPAVAAAGIDAKITEIETALLGPGD